jgi:hypothetical protein
VLTIRFLSGDTRLIQWAAIPGKTYRVQYKDSLADPGWTNLGGTIVAPGETGFAQDLTVTTAAERFYRVVLE